MPLKFKISSVLILFFGILLFIGMDYKASELKQIDESLRIVDSIGFVAIDSEGSKIDVKDDFSNNFNVTTDTNGYLNFSFGINGRFAIDKSSDVFISFENSGNVKSLILNVKKGRVWVNNLYTDIPVNIYTNNTLVIPQKATVLVSFDGLELGVTNFAHDVFVGFLSKPYNELRLSGILRPNFFNSFYLPEMNQIVVNEAKISSKLSNLLLSKLVKEFALKIVFDSDFSDDEWIQNEQKMDSEAEVAYRNSFIDIVKTYSKYSSFAAFRAMYYEYLEARKFPYIYIDENKEVSLDSFLDKISGITRFALLSEENSLYERYLSLWKRMTLYYGYEDYLSVEYKKFESILPSDDFFKLKSEIRKMLYSDLEDSQRVGFLIELLNVELSEIYDLMEIGETKLAVESFFTWSIDARDMLETEPSLLSEYSSHLDVLRRKIVNLFFRYPDFYNSKALEVLNFFDNKIVDFALDKIEQEEVRQLILKERIIILKKLSELVKGNKIDLKVGVELGFAMKAQAETFVMNALYNVAVYDLYKKELEELGVVFEFYDSPDFALMKGKFEDEYNNFVQKKASLNELENYISLIDNFSGKVKRENPKEALGEVYSNFSKFGMFVGEAIALGDSEARLFEVKSVKTDDFVFDAKYDSKSKLIYELEFNGTTYTKGVFLNKLTDYLRSLVYIETTQVEPTQEVVSDAVVEGSALTEAEKLSINLAVQKLKNASFYLGEENIEIIDMYKSIYFVKSVLLDGFEYSLSFEYDGISETVSKIEVEYVNPDGVGSKVFFVKPMSTVNLSDTLKMELEKHLEASSQVNDVKVVRVKRQ